MSTTYRLTIVISILAIIGCAESNKVTPDLPPLIEKLEFPYINNDTLYEFYPDKGESKEVEAFISDKDEDKLELLFNPTDTLDLTVHSPEGNIVYLDIDQSDEVQNDEGDRSLKHTLLPELVVYSFHSNLLLFDLDTRHIHPLFSFNNEDDSAAKICNIYPSVTLDEEHRLTGEILYKNNPQVYVETAQQDCNNDPKQYFQVDIEQDIDTHFEIRRYRLESHNHVSTHYHTHDEGHTHDHPYEAGEIDENGAPFNPNNHAHNHRHSHDLNYGDLEEHMYLSKAEIDEVHNAPENLTTVYETNNVWTARITETSEAIAKVSHPIFNTTTKEVGDLAFNFQDNQYEFYITTESSSFKTLLYTFSLEELGIAPYNQNQDRVSSDKAWFTYFKNSIIFEHNDKLVKLPLLAIFDDDQRAERSNRFTNPIHTFQNLDDYEVIYNEGADSLYIRDGLELYKAVDISSNEQVSTLASLTVESENDIEIFGSSDSILVRKYFRDSEPTTHTQSSIVQLVDSQPVLENTLFPISDNYINIQKGSNDNFLVYGELSNQGEISAREYTSGLGTTHVQPLENTIWARISNMSGADNKPIEQAIISSDDNTLLNLAGREIPALLNANIYTYNSENSSLKGDILGTISGALTEVISIDVKSDFHGEVKIKDSYEANAPIKTYFFPTTKSFINPTGTFGDLKLMYDNSTPVNNDTNEEEPPPSNSDMNEEDSSNNTETSETNEEQSSDNTETSESNEDLTTENEAL